MPRRRRFRILRLRSAMVLLLVGVQAPAVAALAHVTGAWTGPLALAGLLSAPYLPHLFDPWHVKADTRAARALTLAFFGWWAGCLAFWLFGPLGLAAAALLDRGRADGLGVALALAAAAGLRAIWPHPRLVRRSIGVAGLPPEFDGYRIAHLTDVHCGPWTPAHRVRRWVRRINRIGPDLVAVTGDLITTGSSHVRAVSAALGELRARDGVFACMGNHDYFTDGEAFVRALEAGGLRVLRNDGLPIARGAARLWVAGVDDTWTGRDDVARALARRPPGAPAVLLAHDPDLFSQAAASGVALTLSGHTHGGQVAVPVVARRLNLARLITRFSMGIYRAGEAVLYVSRGAGTTGPPFRLGAPAEIAVLTLRAR